MSQLGFSTTHKGKVFRGSVGGREVILVVKSERKKRREERGDKKPVVVSRILSLIGHQGSGESRRKKIKKDSSCEKKL